MAIIRRHADLANVGVHYGFPLWFSKSAWKYYLETPEGMKPLSGVTSICHQGGGGSEALIKWAVKKTVERVRNRFGEHRRGDGWYELFETELESILKDASQAQEDALNDAASCGHIAHSHIESWIIARMTGNVSREMELYAKLPEDERAANCFIAFLDFVARHDVRFLATEKRVVSLDLMYAGTCDATALVSSCDDPSCCSTFFRDQLSVLDHKTSNSLRPPFLLQCSAYLNALEEEARAAGKPVTFEARWVLRYGKEDAEFDPWYMPGRESHEQDFAAFRHALNLSRSLDVLDDRVSGIKTARKAAAALAKEAALRIECPKAKEYKGSRKSKCFEDGTNCEACSKIRENYLASKSSK